MFAIKRKEAVADATRRIARERVDRALSALEPGREADQGIEAERVAREARRGLSLLAVMGPAMDAQALRRERSAFRRLVRGCVAGPLTRKRAEAYCVVLRDVRMRAGYWHLVGDEFAVLRPGLVKVYGKARRKVLTAAVVPDAAERAFLIDALRTHEHALRLVQRSWPELLGAERAKVSALLALLEDQTKDTPDALLEAKAWMSETPGRWCDRVGGYWQAWRGVNPASVRDA